MMNCPLLDTAISDLFHFICELTDAHHLQVWVMDVIRQRYSSSCCNKVAGLLSPMWELLNDRDVRTVSALAAIWGLKHMAIY